MGETISEKREVYRKLLISGIATLADALEKDGRITDEKIAVQALQSGAQSVTAIVREVAAGT